MSKTIERNGQQFVLYKNLTGEDVEFYEDEVGAFEVDDDGLISCEDFEDVIEDNFGEAVVELIEEELLYLINGKVYLLIE